MARNELGHEVPAEVEQQARQHLCLGGVTYIYRDGDYGGPGRWPVASIGCQRPTRFRGDNCANFKVPLKDGWTAFRSPSYTGNPLPPGTPTAPADETPLPAEEELTEEVTALAPLATDEALSEILRLTDPASYSPESDPWLPQAKKLVEEAIDRLVKEFLDKPYLHRVEHSLHAGLFAILAGYPDLAQHFPVGNNLAITQLVHKEWPETFARPHKKNRRGNFDLAVLSPQLLQGCPSIDAFREGRLAAPLVIEIGLDYGARHLAHDAKKLMNSRPKHGYLIHLVRERPRDPNEAQIVLNLEAKTGIKTAYARTAGGQKEFKLVNEGQITEV